MRYFLMMFVLISSVSNAQVVNNSSNLSRSRLSELAGAAALKRDGASDFEMFLLNSKTISINNLIGSNYLKKRGVPLQELLPDNVSRGYLASTALSDYEKELFSNKRITKHILVEILFLRFSNVPESDIQEWLKTTIN